MPGGSKLGCDNMHGYDHTSHIEKTVGVLTNDKENNVKGVRRAKAAPDFSKLHKQWDAKLQKGKAVNKRPLTEVLPFQLTHSNHISHPSDSSNEEEFKIDPESKENILNGKGITEHGLKAERATIADVSRNFTKSLIPRSSFGLQQRNSLYSKKSQQVWSVHNKNEKNSNFPLNDLQCTYLRKSSVTVPKPKAITSSPSVKTAHELQGFQVDFKSDPDALNSILNGTGIPHNGTPSKLSSQFGPAKKNRVKGRAVPFQKPSSNSRFSTGARRVLTDNSATVNAVKQRWSIYSRDSFSTKPDLMTWLKGLVQDSAVGRSSLYVKQATVPTMSNNSTNPKESSAELPSTAPLPAKDVSKVSEESFKFSKTLVGYQGDNMDINVPSGNFATMKPTFPDMGSVGSYITPMKTNRLTIQSNGSRVKSILKKNNTLSQITEESARPSKERDISLISEPEGVKDAIKAHVKSNPVVKTAEEKNTPSNKKPINNKFIQNNSLTPDMRTPVRLSAYARNKKMLGLPLPKENRYERMGEHIDLPAGNDKEEAKTPDSSEAKLQQYVSPSFMRPTDTPSAVKRVRWADSFTSPTKQDAAAQQANRKTDSVSSLYSMLGPNSRVLQIKPANAHQIKFVMPAEQPLENSSNVSKYNAMNTCLSKLDTSAIPVSELTTSKNHSEKNDESAETSTKGSCATILGNGSTDKKRLKSNASRSLNDQFDVPTLRFDEVAATIPTVIQNKASRSSKDKSVKPKKKNRNSILESIYGDAITFAADDSPENESRFHPLNNTVNSSIGLGLRPLPALDENIIGDLISFSEDNENESSIFLKEKIAEPFQSTMLGTPSEGDNLVKPALLGFTPLQRTATKIPEAPTKKLLSVARTPYKQEMLDQLERILSSSRQINNDTLNCTIGPVNSELNETCNTINSNNQENETLCEQDVSLKDESATTPTTISQSMNVLSEQDLHREVILDCRHNLKNEGLHPVDIIEKDLTADYREEGDPKTSFSVLKNMFGNEVDQCEESLTSVTNNAHHYNTQTEIDQILRALTNSAPGSQIAGEMRSPKLLFSNVKNIMSPSMRQFPDHDTATFVTYSENDKATTSNNKQDYSVLKPSYFPATFASVTQTVRSPNIVMLTPKTLSVRLSTNTNLDNLSYRSSVLKPPISSAQKKVTVEETSTSTYESNKTSFVRPTMSGSLSKPLFGTCQFSNPLLMSTNLPGTRTTPTKQRSVRFPTRENPFTPSDRSNQFGLCSGFGSVSAIQPTLSQNLVLTTPSASLSNFSAQRNNPAPITACSNVYFNNPAPITSCSNVYFDNPAPITACSNVYFAVSGGVKQINSRPGTPLINQMNERVNETVLNDSSMIDDDTDVCLVFSKPTLLNSSIKSEVKASSIGCTNVVNQTSNKQVLTSANSSLKASSKTNQKNVGVTSAFRRVPPTCNVFPKVHTNVMNKIPSEGMNAIDVLLTALHNQQKHRSLVLDAEIALYSKFGKISERFGRKCCLLREGALNTVSKLLTDGDEMHFVPVDV